MIIECQACHARFRLDESKIKGKGARVRCRRCNESILVMKEDLPEVPVEMEPIDAAPAAGQFDIGQALEESLGARASAFQPQGQAPPSPEPPAYAAEPPAVVPELPALAPEPPPVAPAPPAFTPEDDFMDLGALSPTAQPESPAQQDAIETTAFPGDWSHRSDAGASGEAPPVVYESGIDPFADAATTAPETPLLLTEKPLELSFESAPPPASPPLDEVDLAFEQFLAGNEREDEASLPMDAPFPELPPEPAQESHPFVLNDMETLDLLGNTVTETAPPAPPASDTMVADPFPFQLDEETMRVPELPATGTGMSPILTQEAEEPPPDRQPSQPQALPPEYPVQKTAVRESAQRKRRESSFRPAVAGLALLFLAIAGTGGYLGFTDAGRARLGALVPSLAPLLGGDNAARQAGSPFDVRNLIGYYDNTTKAGRMFVIKGQVANMGTVAKGRIRIHAALLDASNKTMAEKTVYAGNVLGGEALRTADRETIEKTLSSPFGEKLVNLDIAPGKSVPFMVVFLDIPEGIDAYRLEAKEGE
ncbi:MAG TPA: DUF3426 domain-containing protein [Candidatus Deferrimicrobiaceae bacterium]|jgi:predicted Zn finger-like uncharacterized protein